ncbi:T9SS type A sorting domain-containing protein [Puia dinghuensis]|uniref:Secretion system C-terminal sorting domain-containing protein n=1 Tax=Puia dinghuensis TaxID=1792502 RepID=A0A8J2XS17_9BACT|nr:T9SS type A sorting domain-containing protein [Puia dinghuensis]GGA91606.1 hypothetical protein GCM10011511_13710 [Puia dinghuensis]
MKKIYSLLILTLCSLSFSGVMMAQVCSSPGTTIYGLTNAGAIYPISTSNANVGAKVNTAAYSNPAPSGANAIGYNNINGQFYYFKRSPSSGTQQFVSYDPTLNVYNYLTSCPTANNVNSGCVTFNGLGYYCLDVMGGLFYYNIAGNSWTQVTTTMMDQNNANVTAIIQSQSSGDIAEDGLGNLWMCTSSSSQYGLYEIKAAVPTTVTATVNVIKVVAPGTLTPTGTSFAGVAFGTNGAMYLSTSADNRLYMMNANYSLSYIGTFNVGNVGADLTSCNFPIALLPVTWHSFSALLQSDGDVSLNWIVSTQVNNKGFGVEYSQDGATWTELAFIDGAGNEEQDASYSYIHHSPAAGKNFYRIRQVDNNGLASYSAIKTIDIQQSNVLVSCWPNPAKDQIQIRTTKSSMQGASVRIFDRSGKLIIQSVWASEFCSINISSLPAGIYLIHIQSVEGEMYNTKVLKQ